MQSKVVKNYIYNVSYQVLMVLAPLITTPYISRVLHPTGVGIYSYTATIATAFGLVAALGVNNYGQREIAYVQEDRAERSRVFWELLITRIATTLPVTIIYLVFAANYHGYSIYLLAQAFAVVGTMFDISWLFSGMEDFKTIAVRNVVVKLVTIVLIFILVRDEGDVLTYILINSVSTVVSFTLFFVKLGGYVDRIPKESLHPLRHMRGNLEFFIPILATQIYSQLDKIMLGAMLANSVESGYYEQARKIVNVIIIVVTSINTVMYPRISNLYKKGETKEIVRYYSLTFRAILMLTLPILAGLYIVAPVFTAWFFGEEFMEVSTLIRLSCPMLIFMALGNFAGVQYLSPMGKQNQMTAIYIVAAVFNLVLNFFLIPSYGAVGTMVSSIAAEGLSCFGQLWLLRGSEYKFRMSAGWLRYVLATGIMSIVLSMVQNTLQSSVGGIALLGVEVAGGSVLYFGALLLLDDEVLWTLCTMVRERFLPDTKE